MPPFPAEAVPDGAILAPHHLYVGALLVVLAALPAVDDHPEREPMAVLIGAIIGAAAFLTVWPFYPATGAALTFAFALVCVVAPIGFPFWRDYQWRGLRGLVLLGGLVMLDDVISHAFGIWTPLDGWLWKGLLYPIIA